MTPTQQKYLEFIIQFSKDNKRYPRRGEIAEAFELNVSTVKEMINRLIMNDYIIRAPYKREIGNLTKKARQELGLDII